MTSEELQQLLTPEAQAMLQAHQHDNPTTFALRYSNRHDLPIRALAEQLACRRKAERKLPTLSRHNLLYTTLSLEQASSERTARFKCTFMQGKRCIDLSGGLGIDAIFLAAHFEELLYCERNELLCNVVRHNMVRCGIGNVRLQQGDSLSFLASQPDNAFDWIMVDPARREEGKRSIGLEAASPNVVASQELLLAKAPHICIKASPALEISNLKMLLPALHTILVVSVSGECKEILLLLKRGAEAEHPITKAICLQADNNAVVEIVGTHEQHRSLAESLQCYLYEPDAAIIKARLSGVVAKQEGLEFLNKSVDYLTSNHVVASFAGKVFQVIESVPYKPKEFRKFLDRHAISAASIQRRDFPLSADELRKKFRLREDEKHFLIFTRNRNAEPICIYAERC
uniref:THUMP-like domain-containing protein n=1 Tax=Chlorobium chlorochromatii (strain CaD3) TaxID=340177 RepID=Q3ANS3_CHLCH